MLAATADITSPSLPSSGSMKGPSHADLDAAVMTEPGDDPALDGTDSSASELERARARRERGFGLQTRRQPAWRDHPWDSGCLTFL